MLENSLICSLFTNSLSDDINPAAWKGWKDNNVVNNCLSYKSFNGKDFNDNTVSYSGACFYGALYYTKHTRVLGDKDFTIQFWYYISSASRKMDVDSTICNINENFCNDLRIFYSGYDNRIYMNVGGWRKYNVNFPTTEKTWHHMAIVYKNNHRMLYYYHDGTLLNTEDIYISRFNISKMYLGRYITKDSDYGYGFFNGYLKDFQIYDGVAKFSGDTIDIYDIKDVSYTPYSDYNYKYISFCCAVDDYNEAFLDDYSGIYDTRQLSLHGTIVNKNLINTGTFNDFKHIKLAESYEDSWSSYFDGKSGFYFDSSLPLFDNYFTLSFWAKANTTNTNERTMICLRSAHPEKNSVSNYFRPCIIISTLYDGTDQYYYLRSKNFYLLKPSGISSSSSNNYFFNDIFGKLYTKNTKWNNYTIIWNFRQLYFYVDGKLIGSALINYNFDNPMNYEYYLCFGFSDIGDDTTKFIGYLKNFTLKDEEIETDKNYSIIPSIYAGYTVPTSDLTTYTRSIIANYSTINNLNSDKCELIYDNAECMGYPILVDNLSEELYNNNVLLYNSKYDLLYNYNNGDNFDFSKGILIDSSDYIITRRPIELFRKNFTISCWIKKQKSGNTILPFAFSQMHPTQIPQPNDLFIEYLNNIYIEIHSYGIIFKNLLTNMNKNTKFNIYIGESQRYYYNESDKEITRTGFDGYYSLSDDKELQYSLDNLWNHVAMTFVAEKKTFYFYLNGKLLFSSKTNILYNELIYYIYIGGGNSDAFYINGLNIDTNVAECTSETWVKYFSEPINTEFTNAKFSFKYNMNDENPYNNWVIKGSPTLKSGLALDSFNNIKHPQNIFSDVLYLNGSSGFYTKNPIKLFDKDFTISGWFKATSRPATNTYRNLIKITREIPTQVPATRYGDFQDDILLTYWAENYAGHKDNAKGTLYQYTSYSFGVVSTFIKDTYDEANELYTSSTATTKVTSLYPDSNKIYYSKFECDTDSVDTYWNNIDDLLNYWCHFSLVYKKPILYIYYNGKLEETVNIGNRDNQNYYILLGMGYCDSNNTGCFVGYVKDFEIDYGIAKYTDNTIPEIYTNPINRRIHKLDSYELGDWASLTFATTEIKNNHVFLNPNTIYIGKDSFKNDLYENFEFYNIFDDTKAYTKNANYLTTYSDNSLLNKGTFSGVTNKNSVYFNENIGLVSKEILHLFNKNFILHMWFNYAGPKYLSTKKYLFRIISVDPKEGYNNKGMVSFIDAYILGDNLYFNEKSGYNYSFNPNGNDSFSSYQSNNQYSIPISSSSLYNGKYVNGFYSEYPISDYLCNISLTYDSSKKIFHLYYNGKQIGTIPTSTDFSKYMYYIYIGFGDYNNTDTNWIGHITEIYINHGSAKCIDATFPAFYYGTYFAVNNLTTTLPLKDYSRSVTNLDDHNLGIFATAGALANKSVTAPTFDDSRTITSNAYFNGKAGIYSVTPLNLFYKGFTIDFWALSTSTKTTGHEVLLKLIIYPPTGQLNLSNTILDKLDMRSDSIGTFIIYYDYEWEYLYFQIILHGKIVRDETNKKYIYYTIDESYYDDNDKIVIKFSTVNNTTATSSSLLTYTNHLYIDNFKEKWQHIAVSYDNRTHKLRYYLNGKSYSSYNEDYYLYYYLQYLQIGFDNTLNNNYKWNGYITEFNISSPDVAANSFFPGISTIPVVNNFKSLLYLTNTSNVLYQSTSGDITWTAKGRLIVDTYLNNIKSFNISKHKPVSNATYFDENCLIFTEKQLKLFDKDFTTSFWAKLDFNFYTMNYSYAKTLLRISSAHPSLSVSGSTMADISISYIPGDDYNTINFKLSTITNSTQSYISGENVKFNKSIYLPMLKTKWCHFALCYTVSENKFYFYINGELVYTVNPTIDLTEYTYYVYLGGHFKHNNTYNWNGYIYNFEIVSQPNVSAYYTEDKISTIWAPPTLINFKANLPLTKNLDDTYNNTWLTKLSPQVIDIENGRYTFSYRKHGKFNNALYFNGNSGLYTYNSIELFEKNFTMSLWFTIDDIIITTKSLLAILPVEPTETVYNVIMPCFDIYYNNNYIKFRHYTLTNRSLSSNSGFNSKFEITTKLSDLKSKFHHLAITYTANNKKFYFYIDGKLIGTNSTNMDLTFFVYYFWIGLYYNTDNMYDWQGYIRNLEIDATTAKYTSDTISTIYTEPDVTVTKYSHIRRLLAGLRSRSFNTIVQNAIDAPILYNPSLRNVLISPKVKSYMLRYIQALRSNTQSLLRQIAHRQKYQFNETQRLLAKYLEFKFNINRTVERTRKAIAISVKSLQ